MILYLCQFSMNFTGDWRYQYRTSIQAHPYYLQPLRARTDGAWKLQRPNPPGVLATLEQVMCEDSGVLDD